MDAAATPAVGDVLGDYALEEALGEGATGIVFRAVDRRDGTVVAVKVLRPELAADAVYVRRFEREVEVASALRHPRLLPVLGAAVVDGVRLLVTEFAAERTLADRLVEGALSLRELIVVATSIGDALDALTGSDLVHRDVTPRNVLVGPDGARLADFGLARGPAHTVLTRTGQVVGNVAYLAPELIEGGTATAASDIYALGCVLFHGAAGRPPFTGKLFEVVHAHVDREPPNPVADRPELPAGVGDAIRAALAKEPARRPATGRLLGRLVRLGAAGGP